MKFQTNYKIINCVYLLATCALLFTPTISSFIEVTSEANSGPGTLRQAIIDTNIFGDDIVFASHVTTIKLLTPLPVITNNITIDGLATIVNGRVQAGDCNSLPSPVSDPKGFSAALSVTIDGSLIPSSEPFSGFGLGTIGMTTITGLKIKNFTGSVVYPDAIGIRGGAGTGKPLVQCCEISNILSRATETTIVDSETITTTGNAIGINNADTVTKCLIKNIKTSPLLHPKTGTHDFILATGNAIGINNFNVADQCNVNTLCGGDMFAHNNQSGYTLFLGQTIGFQSKTANETPVIITNSLANNIKGGSVSTNYSDSSILPVNSTDQLEDFLQYNTCGAFIDGIFSENSIETSTFCNIQAGTITTCNSNMTVTTPFAAGIVMRANKGTVTTNMVSDVRGGRVYLGGAYSTALLPTALGVVNSSLSPDSTSNTISTITAGCSRIDGECSHIAPQFLFTYPNYNINYYLPTAIGLLHFEPTRLSMELDLSQNNNIKKIIGGEHTAHGLYSSISSTGSVGIASINSNDHHTSNNSIKKISGPKLTASDAALIAKNIQASAGIQIIARTVDSINNTIESIQETNICSLGKTPAINGFNFSLHTGYSTTILPIFTSGIYIDSLSYESEATTKPLTICSNNNVSAIAGSKTISNAAKQGSISTGIFFRRPSITNPSLEECADDIIGLFENNTIFSITGGTYAPGFGILLNQDFHLQNLEAFSLSNILNNTISKITGHILRPYILTQTELIAECPLEGSGSEENIAHTILPCFPYGPSAGINLFASGCGLIKNNVIKKISSSENQARGISTVASSNIGTSNNTITTINGPGIFVGGASANIEHIDQAGVSEQEFENAFPSVRNTIFNNSTSADMTQGIELGVVNWNNYLASIAGSNPQTLDKEEIIIIGNHDQPAPHIKKVLCNSNGTTTIDITFSDKNHPNSTFIVQFFRNSTNTVPHGEQAITQFTKNFEFTTDSNGAARARFVLMPAYKINKSDTISAHVTLITDRSMGTDGSTDHEFMPNTGDTSEFTMQKTNKRKSQLGCITSCNKLSKERTSLNNILSCKR